MNLGIFEKYREREKDNNFIESFVKDLRLYLEANGSTFNVVTNLNQNGTYHLVRKNGNFGDFYIDADKLPKETRNGTVLRYDNDKFTIDKILTDERMNEIKEMKEYSAKIRWQEQNPYIDYIVERKVGSTVEVKNAETGYTFGLGEMCMLDEERDVVKEGMILQYKDDIYTFKEVDYEK